MKNNIHIDSEEEPSPINYQAAIGGGPKILDKNKLPDELRANHLSSMYMEKKKIFTDQLSKLKLQEEEIDDELLRDVNINLGYKGVKYNNKCYSNEMNIKGKQNEKMDYIETNEALNSGNEDDSDNFQKSSAGMTIQSKNNLTSGNNKQSRSITITNNTQYMSGEVRNNNLNSIKSTSQNKNSEIVQFKSDKSIGVMSETSLKPRKGDKTPKSNISDTNSDDNEENYLQINNKAGNDFDNNRLNTVGQQDISQLNMPNKSLINNTTEKLKTQNSEFLVDKNYNQFDIQQLSYELVKEYSHLRIDKDESFMRRMLFDVFKRQTKEERMNKLIDRNIKKIDENERVKTFNRLIEDANRRLEAQEKLEEMKIQLDDNLINSNNKKYKHEEWEEIYEDRFLKYKNEKEKKIDEKINLKNINKKQLEDEIVENLKSKTKRLPQNVINQSVNRMYEEAQRRKLKLDERRKKNVVNMDNMENSQEFGEEISEGEAKDLIKDKHDALPSQFKKFGKAQKYNFQVTFFYLLFSLI